jgi:hypothetical protein
VIGTSEQTHVMVSDEKRSYGFWLEADRFVELYEPPASGVEPMMRGKCPVCGVATGGYEGRYAVIRELDDHGHPVISEFTTSYGHLPCIAQAYQELCERFMGDVLETEHLTWHKGKQRDVLLFVEQNTDHVVEVRKVAGRGRAERYDYRLRRNE